MIAETKEEDAMLPGLTALMNDLGIDVVDYRTDEAYAITFWSASDLCHMYSDAYDLSYEEAVAILEEVEPFLTFRMSSAGVKYIDRSIQKYLPKVRC